METGKVNKTLAFFEKFSARFRIEYTAGLDLFIMHHSGAVFFGIEDPTEKIILAVGSVDAKKWPRHPIAKLEFKNRFEQFEAREVRLIPESFFEKENTEMGHFWCPGSGVFITYLEDTWAMDIGLNTRIPRTAALLESSSGNLSHLPESFSVYQGKEGFEFLHHHKRKLQHFHQEKSKSLDDTVYHLMLYIQSQDMDLKNVELEILGWQAEELCNLFQHFVPKVAVSSLLRQRDVEQLIPASLLGVYTLLFQSDLCV